MTGTNTGPQFELQASTLPANGWHALLAEFADASIEQTCSYAAARGGSVRLEHVVLRLAGQPVAAAQVTIARLPVVGLGFAFVKFAPLVQRVDRTATDSPPTGDACHACIASLKRIYVSQRHLSLRIMPAVRPALNHGAAPPLAGLLHAAGFECEPVPHPDRYLVDLGVPLPQILAGLKPKWRYNLRRAQRQALRLEEASGEAAVDRFMALYSQMVSRKSFNDTSGARDLPVFYADLPPRLRPRIFFCSMGEQTLGAVVVSIVGDTAVYLYGATADSALRAGAGYFMQWSVIEHLAEAGFRWYDLGGHGGDQGLLQFKSGLVGRTGAVLPLPGVFDLHPGALRGHLIKLALRAREVLLGVRGRLASRVPRQRSAMFSASMMSRNKNLKLPSDVLVRDY